MSGSQPRKTTDPIKSGKPLEITARIEQNVRPLVSEVQRRAAKTSVSGRHAVFRGRLFLLFYLWMLVGAVFLSLLARRTSFLPGDRAITSRLQKQRNPWLRRLFYAVSEIGFPNISTPITLAVAGIFYALRFRLEAFFILLTSSSVLLNVLVKRLIKRPRPAKELVTVVRVINEPSFPSGHVMYFTNFYGLLIYLLATNWRSGKLRNLLITLCILLIVAVGPSRVYLGAHWPSDVLAGYIYGGLWFTGLMALYLRVKAWIHPPQGETPPLVRPFKQPGENDEES